MRAGKLYSLLLLAAVTLGQSCRAGGGTDPGEGVPQQRDSSQAGGKAPGDPGCAGLKKYDDPGGAFSVKMPCGWKAAREELKAARKELDGANMTVITSDEYRAANLSILTKNEARGQPRSADLQEFALTEASRPFFQGWINGLKEQARVEGLGEVYRTRFANLDARRLDITYYRGDGDDPRKGYGLFLIGRETIFFISLTAARPVFGELEKIISTLEIEP
jgi:hypothetical protein